MKCITRLGTGNGHAEMTQCPGDQMKPETSAPSSAGWNSSGAPEYLVFDDAFLTRCALGTRRAEGDTEHVRAEHYVPAGPAWLSGAPAIGFQWESTLRGKEEFPSHNHQAIEPTDEFNPSEDTGHMRTPRGALSQRRRSGPSPGATVHGKAEPITRSFPAQGFCWADCGVQVPGRETGAAPAAHPA